MFIGHLHISFSLKEKLDFLKMGLYKNKHCNIQNYTWDRDQDYCHGKEMQKSKMAVWGGLTNSCEKKRSEKKEAEKERYKPLNAELQE